MVDIPNRFSPHPRPLLPLGIGVWTSQSLLSVQSRYLELEGYFEPTYTDISKSCSVYLEYPGDGSNLRGIHTDPSCQPNPQHWQEVKLNSASRRTVKLLCLKMQTVPFATAVFLQVIQPS
jgi:hypothetical protein